MDFKPPSFKGSAFHCPWCGAYAHMTWEALYAQTQRAGFRNTSFLISTCGHCHKSSCWLGVGKNQEGAFTTGRMIEPVVQAAPQPHPDMPADVASDYREAMAVVSESPRAAAALLRPAIQKLCKELGEPGKNINDDIGSLVKKGLPLEIQQALDIVRVVGNNAVHPGALSSTDVATVSASLFELVNYIVEDRISRPKKLAAMFSGLPEPARAGIASRDKAGT
jgi:hypothetical protein